VEAWAQHLGVPVAFDEHDFFAARIQDPDGNIFEIYWDKL
jgi:catechol-2,3-dioxygenase